MEWGLSFGVFMLFLYFFFSYPQKVGTVRNFTSEQPSRVSLYYLFTNVLVVLVFEFWGVGVFLGYIFGGYKHTLHTLP